MEGLLASGEQGSGSRVVVDVTYEEAHSIYALLVCTLLLFANEETFFSRIGAFRENLTDMAHGFWKVVRELGD
ncbi:hypothetical protein E1293_40290 [Actinomadura darangshiensis]|uniref:Uncharacterized protein n=1 Tax=Actinomadura darangshiensis TaxID=705336 RepID=A0A4V2YRB0_9ACTN|nr:hypothetical protein [Actinomadura darangshiensis]TDD65437.1 hypothetical protein E1293_40290 [Actinomadura darangshiensis]